MSGPGKKAVVSTTNVEAVDHQVRFTPQFFNSLIFDKGYEVYIDKALRCPCAVKGNGQALISCNNCIGTGWIFMDRVSTRIAIQGINAEVKYQDWSKLSTGMAKVTARAIDRLAFMDRIIVREAEGYFNEILRPREHNGKMTCFTTYEILEIESIMMFDNDKSPLKRIPAPDYTIENEKIILHNKYLNQKDLTLTIRYRHHLTYHIIDMNRDITKVRTKEGCSASNEELQSMPINGTARKAHYLFDNLKYEESSRLIDNTDEHTN
jgi:hypothetical protein